MFINAKVDLSFSDEGLDIRIRDDDSGLTFVELHMGQKEACQVMSRLSSVPAEKCELRGLDKVGKKMEVDYFEFGMDENIKYADRREEAFAIARDTCPEGWVPDNYFGSQNSFRNAKNGQLIARATIRRWVEKE